jgi:GNAT superfamily N-acetyltransferase
MGVMTTDQPSIGGVPVTIRLAMKMEDTQQAFAVRAACFIGEQDLPFSEEFDGHDYDATHVIAYAGEEPVGTVRVRWFASFAMTERLAVMRRYRGHGVGGLLLERCRELAQSRGCNVLYAQVLPHDTGYWAKQGWRRLVPQAQSRIDDKAIVSMVKAADPMRPLPETEAPEAIVLRREPHLDATVVPMGTIPN